MPEKQTNGLLHTIGVIMKKLIIILIFCFISISLLATEIKEKEFKVTFSITFNSMTLKQAAEVEKKISRLFKDAEFNIDINKMQENNGSYFLLPNTEIKIIDDETRKY